MAAAWIPAGVALAPVLVFGFAGAWCAQRVERLPRAARILAPAALAAPYLVMALATHGTPPRSCVPAVTDDPPQRGGA